jgi:hypothetical protein
MTAVEFLENQYNTNGKLTPVDFYQAFEMEKQQSKDYAIFAVNCDRKQLPVLDFDDYIFLYKI